MALLERPPLAASHVSGNLTIALTPQQVASLPAATGAHRGRSEYWRRLWTVLCVGILAGARVVPAAFAAVRQCCHPELLAIGRVPMLPTRKINCMVVAAIAVPDVLLN